MYNVVSFTSILKAYKQEHTLFIGLHFYGKCF